MAGSKPEIGAKIVLDGAEEYQRSLKEVANAQKDLNKEMKLAESEFKATGDAQKLYNEKVRLLNAQMDNQKKKLETAQKALKELADKGVDKNSDLWRKWNGILLDSQTKMNTLQAELNTTTAAMRDTADATEQVSSATEQAAQSTADYTETLKSIDRGVKFGNILNGLSKVTSAVKGVISTAYNMGKALLMSQLSGGDWAREIMIEAARAGVSVEEYQARQYAQAVSGIDTNVINEGVKKTIENIGSTDAELIKLYGTYGIETRKATGEARNATEVFWETVDAIKGISDETTRSIIAQKLLGDQFMEMRALIDLGSEGYAKLIEEGKQNATITEESVNALSDMDAAAEKVKKTSETLAHNVQANLAPGFTAVADALSTTIQKFNEFVASEEGKQIFADWNESLSGIATTIKDVDFQSALSSVSTAFETIADALTVIANTWGTVKDSFNFYKTWSEKGLGGAIEESAKGSMGERLSDTGLMRNFVDNQNKLTEYILQQSGHSLNGEDKNQSSAAQSEDLQKYAEELRSIHSGITSAYLKNDYESIYKDVLGILENENYKPFLKDYNIRQGLGSFLDAYESGNTMTDGYLIYGAMKDLMAHVDSIMSQTAETAASGGGSAMRAFNDAMEKEGAKTENALGKAVSNAFSGIDDVFASMGRAHGAAYISALSSQMSRINSLISMRPTYFGSFSSGAQSAYASPTSATNLTASLYVGKDRVGSVFTPIINDQMGVDLQVIR